MPPDCIVIPPVFNVVVFEDPVFIVTFPDVPLVVTVPVVNERTPELPEVALAVLSANPEILPVVVSTNALAAPVFGPVIVLAAEPEKVRFPPSVVNPVPVNVKVVFCVPLPSAIAAALVL